MSTMHTNSIVIDPSLCQLSNDLQSPHYQATRLIPASHPLAQYMQPHVQLQQLQAGGIPNQTMQTSRQQWAQQSLSFLSVPLPSHASLPVRHEAFSSQLETASHLSLKRSGRTHSSLQVQQAPQQQPFSSIVPMVGVASHPSPHHPPYINTAPTQQHVPPQDYGAPTRAHHTLVSNVSHTSLTGVGSVSEPRTSYACPSRSTHTPPVETRSTASGLPVRSTHTHTVAQPECPKATSCADDSLTVSLEGCKEKLLCLRRQVASMRLHAQEIQERLQSHEKKCTSAAITNPQTVPQSMCVVGGEWGDPVDVALCTYVEQHPEEVGGLVKQGGGVYLVNGHRVNVGIENGVLHVMIGEAKAPFKEFVQIIRDVISVERRRHDMVREALAAQTSVSVGVSGKAVAKGSALKGKHRAKSKPAKKTQTGKGK